MYLYASEHALMDYHLNPEKSKTMNNVLRQLPEADYTLTKKEKELVKQLDIPQYSVNHNGVFLEPFAEAVYQHILSDLPMKEVAIGLFRKHWHACGVDLKLF